MNVNPQEEEAVASDEEERPLRPPPAPVEHTDADPPERAANYAVSDCDEFDTAFYADHFCADITDTSYKLTAMTAAQRKKVQKGAEHVAEQDQAMWSALQGHNTSRMLLMICLYSHLFAPAIGQVAKFVEPGDEAVNCNEQYVSHISNMIEEQNYTTIYMHIPVKDCSSTNPSYERSVSYTHLTLPTILRV